MKTTDVKAIAQQSVATTTRTVVKCGKCGSREVEIEQEKVSPAEPYRCTHCGSTDVQRMVWARPNRSNEYVDDVGECELHEDACWCENCEGHHVIKPQHELMEDIDYWFFNELQPDDPEVITGLCEYDYPSAEAYEAAVTEFWQAQSDESKIHIWKALTYDKTHADE